jgi:AcrR family transcriptional regulator
VQRATVYRHFPDEAALLGACSAHWATLHPPPDAAQWGSIEDPDERLRVALRALYRWYGSDERMFVNTMRDAELVPALKELVDASRSGLDALYATLWRDRPERGAARRAAARARRSPTPARSPRGTR